MRNSLIGKAYTNGNQIQELFTPKSAEFYLNGIEKLPDKWQQINTSIGGYIIEKQNVIVLYL